VQLRLFANRYYSLITVAASAQFLVLISLQLLLSLYLIQLRGFAAGVAGLLILPLATTLAALIVATLIVAGIGMSLVQSQGATGVSLVVFKSE
jgi:hypothetical protein